MIQSIANNYNYTKQIREHIHANPELSFEEYNTSKYIKQHLDALGIDAKPMAGTGWVATIKGNNPTKHCIGFRADFDALPITEENDVAYKSNNVGVMHACGHDAHTAMLLGATKTLLDNMDQWYGTVKLIFQPGEEKDPGGASIMIKEGILTNPEMDAIFALHAYPLLPVGSVGTKAGMYMASADEVYITINGKGGHAATPHLCIDPIAISAQIIIGLQQLISRVRNPIDNTVFTIGKIQGGTKGNIIPNQVLMEGTLRCMNEQWRTQCHTLITKYCTEIAATFGATANVKILVGYPCVYNNEALTNKVNTILQPKGFIKNRVDLPLRMTADDFSFYTHKIPGCYIRIGTSNLLQDKFTSSVHTPTFDIEPTSLQVGVQTICDLVKNFSI